MIDHRLISTYLNDHLTGASVGVELFRRAAKSHANTNRGPELAALTREIEQDVQTLREILRRLDVEENKPMMALGWAAEKVGRLKPNGYLVRRSPLADLVELEGLRGAVAGKTAGWQVLRALAMHDDRLTKEEFEVLLQRADDQSQRLYKLHLQVAQAQFDERGS